MPIAAGFCCAEELNEDCSQVSLIESPIRKYFYLIETK